MTTSWLLKPSFGSVVITILMTLQISACSMEEFAEAVADNIVSDTSNISSGTSDISDISGANQVAVISGTDNGSVTEDYDPDADNLLEIDGKLNITDSDTGEADTSTTEPVSEPVSEPAPAVSDVSLSWVAPAEREDNTGISLSEIAGYKVYYGTTQGNYNNSVDINDGTAEGYTFNNFSYGTYYFVVTTYDTERRESQYSTVVKIVI